MPSRWGPKHNEEGANPPNGVPAAGLGIYPDPAQIAGDAVLNELMDVEVVLNNESRAENGMLRLPGARSGAPPPASRIATQSDEERSNIEELRRLGLIEAEPSSASANGAPASAAPANARAASNFLANVAPAPAPAPVSLNAPNAFQDLLRAARQRCCERNERCILGAGHAGVCQIPPNESLALAPRPEQPNEAAAPVEYASAEEAPEEAPELTTAAAATEELDAALA